eukprot:TRINITY_DN42633_c0_g1_i1.p1 TRINITY_DN42633_c0_g1~~TRINITY_DN42633_c0_g1_i1.p1  ORF type:complete len:166 (-),score=27.70 TRINITY_DN42633_c0_g1_i1:123-620(-)
MEVEKQISRFRGTLSEIMDEFSCGIGAVSLQTHDEEWSVHILPDGSQMDEELLMKSSLFKVLVKRAMPTVVPDTLDTTHLATDPLVVRGPKIRFYAEIPVTNYDGGVIGSVIFADCEPLHKLDWDTTALCKRAVALAEEMSALTASVEAPEVQTAVPSFDSHASW